MVIGLRDYGDDDLALSLELETDPVAMAELGGPRPVEDIERVHPQRVAERFAFVIEDDGEAVGTIGAWATEHDDEPIHETGWMVLPRAQGRGVASRGLVLLIERLREEPDLQSLHAFPGQTNVPSNRLCEKTGFTDLGPVTVDFGGHELRCHHWVLDLSATP